MLNRLAHPSLAQTMPVNSSIQDSLIMDYSSGEEEKEVVHKTPIPKHVTPAGISANKGTSPTQFSSVVTSNDEAYGVTANNPIRKIARDITALSEQVIMPGVNGKWVAHTLRVLTKRPMFTGECEERINWVDPQWAASYT